MMDDTRIYPRLHEMDMRAVYLISICSKDDANTLIGRFLEIAYLSENAISELGLEIINEFMDMYYFKPIELKKWNYEENFKLVERFMNSFMRGNTIRHQKPHSI